MQRRPWTGDDRTEVRRRVLLVCAGLAAVAGLLVLVVWVAPALLVGDAEDRFRTDVRTGLAAAVFALVAVGVGRTASTWRSTRREQTTDRFLQAIGQLGHESVAVRVGGVYVLERLMTDSPEDQRPIVEVLAAYVREQAPARATERRSTRPTPDLRLMSRQPSPSSPARTPLPQERVDLSATDLRGADLTGAQLEGTACTGAHLRGAHLSRGALTAEQLEQAATPAEQIDWT